jgi:hypothetical protein
MTLPRHLRPQTRETYARTWLDFLVNDPSGFPTAYPPGAGEPPLWWYGQDSGGGAYPIGPNGPYANGTGSEVGAVPAITRATSLITGPLTAAPFRVLSGVTQVDAPRWLTDPMLLRHDDRFWGGNVYPEVRQVPRSHFWSEWVRSAVWWGEGAFICTEDAQRQPMAGSMRNVHHATIGTERNDNGALVWNIAADSHEDRLTFDRDGRAKVGPVTYRIVVLRNPHSTLDPEGRAKGVFAMSPGVFRLAGQVESYAQGTFRSGIPAGYLKVQTPGLTREAADELKGRWMAAHGGDRRSIAVLNATTEFQPLHLSPVDAALDQVKRLNLADVAFAFGLDPMTLGAGLQNSATYTNVRDAWQNHRDFGLAPWTAALEDTLTALLPGSGTVHVNLDGFANPTKAERFAAWKVALDAGIVTLDEVRAAEGLPQKDDAPPPESQPVPKEPEPTTDDEDTEGDGNG